MNINGYIIFDGLDTRTLSGVTVVRGETLEAPAREFDVREIPGRNGDLIIDGNKYQNVDITYWVMIRSNFMSTFRTLSGFLLSRTGYCKLSDSWHTDEFYYAYVSQPITPQVDRGMDRGAFELVFSRKPQRFLVSGDTPATLTPTVGVTPPDTFAHLENPTYFPSRPKVTVTLAQNLGSSVFTLFEAGLFTQLPTSRSNFDPLCAEGTRRAVVLYAGFQVSMSGYGAQGDEIVIDCESRSVFNKTKNKSLNAITYLMDSGGAPGSGDHIYYPDFPEIQPILATDYISFTIMFANSTRFSAMSVLPRWWAV